MAGEAEAVAAILGGLFGGGGGGGTKSPYGYSESSSFGVGGSSGTNQSTSYSEQRPDKVWGAQVPFFQNLWGQGAGLLASGGNQAMGQDIANQGAGAFNQMLNPGSNPMLDIYAQDLGQAFNQNILPQISREATGLGALGGSRQQIAEGLAGQEMARQLSTFGGRQYESDMNRMLGTLAQTSALGNFAMGIPWQGLNQMAGLLGSPVVLGQGGFSTSQSTGQTSSFEESGSSGFDVSGPKQGFVDPFLPGAGATGGGSSSPFQPQSRFGDGGR